MSFENQNEISSAIKDALKNIPVVWPLQQFIATNPAWDLIDKPISDINHTLQNIQTTSSLSEYLQHYQNDEISDSSLHQSIKNFSHRIFKDTPEQRIDSATNSLFKRLLYGFMTNIDHQASLDEKIENASLHQKSHQKILLSYQIRQQGYDNALESNKSDCLNWLSAYFNPTNFQQNLLADVEPKENNKNHFYHFWHTVLSHKNGQWKTFLEAYPADEKIHVIINNLLSALSVPQSAQAQYLREVTWQLKGWMGYAKWQQQHPNNPYFNKAIDPSEVIAMWLAYEVFWLKKNKKLLTNFEPTYQITDQNIQDETTQACWLNYIDEVCQDFSMPTTTFIKSFGESFMLSSNHLKWIWQRAYEISYQDPLCKTLLDQKINKTENSPAQTKAQWVFCIDVRSEGFRRHLEQVGPYETFGFAGFFGVAYQLKDQAQQKQTCQCPAIIDPSLLANMLEAPQSLCQSTTTGLSRSINRSKKSIVAPFALYEILGFWFALTLVLKNYGHHFLNKIKKRCMASEKNIQLENIDTDTMASIGKNLLKGMGLTQNFSEFVMMCGHSTSTENNPYQAGLDCGACGGNSGMSNAVIACQILNNKAVRENLKSQGIIIPEGTAFIAACHDTTTDEIKWHADENILNDKQRKQLEIIKQDAVAAGMHLQKERLQTLPGNHNGVNRSGHWAELIPEWGLANNAAFIIAHRDLTKSIDLERRVFLHSYDPGNDPDLSILESIFLGPVLVAHWINSQYYFSSVNPEHYGSGNKTIHNILPKIGVMEGNQSDLKYGLPQQSVFYQGERTHKPQRLLVVVDANQSQVDTILNKHPTFKSLVDGEWVFVKCLRE